MNTEFNLSPSSTLLFISLQLVVPLQRSHALTTLRTAARRSAVTSISVAGVHLSVASDTNALGVVLDCRQIFRKHNGGSTIVQLSFSGHPPYTPSTVHGTCGNTGLQSHTDQTGLLQLSAVRCSSQQHSSSAASECKTMQSGSFSRLQDDLIPSHYCVSCIGYPFNTESSTRWLC